MVTSFIVAVVHGFMAEIEGETNRVNCCTVQSVVYQLQYEDLKKVELMFDVAEDVV